jgi:ATP/maltotriose-dependent transcriptional regulator MalT
VETLRVLPADLRAEMPDLLWIAVLNGAMANPRQWPQLGALLGDFRRRLESTRNSWLALRVRAMQVVHYLHGDDQAAAEAELDALLPEIERSGMLRTVLDWPQLEPLLARSQASFAQRLSGMFRHGVLAGFPFGLSEHEMRVLRGIAANSSTAEIARKMFIETSTVRKHLVNLFRKMGVHSRAEAVHAAREAGLR